MSSLTDRVAEYTPSDEDGVDSWLIERYVTDCGLTLRDAKRLVRAGADWHKVKAALDAGATKALVLEIFA